MDENGFRDGRPGKAVSKLQSLLSLHPKRAVEEALRAGDRERAMGLLARAGEWRDAARLAAELGDEEKLVRYSLTAAFGQPPKGDSPGLFRAAEMLATGGFHSDAIPLFERAGAFLQAGESALALRQSLRAARYFKQAGSWLQAVRCYEEAGKLGDALRTAEEGLLSLERTAGKSAVNAGRLKELQAMRSDLLLRQGRGDAEEAPQRSTPPANQSAERLLAEAFLRTGRHAEAAHLLAQLGRPREAAEAYEAAKDWGRAAYRWEAAEEPRRAAEAYEKAGQMQDAARCYKAAGMPERAAEAFVRPGSAAQGAALGQTLQAARTYLAAGDKAQAGAVLIRMRPEEPGFAEGVILLVPLLIEEGFYEDALGRLRGLPGKLAPEIAVERDYWEGRGLEALGRNEAARACFERVAARAPGHRDNGERLGQLRGSTKPVKSVTKPVKSMTRPVKAMTTPVRSQPEPSSDVPAVGRKLAGRYEILAELGRGGMGRVYKAYDHELGETVAMKTVLTSAEGGAGEETRLLREVQICRRISHPSVVRVYDIGRFANGLFVTMEHIEGVTLNELIAKESPLPFARIRSLLSEITSGLAEAHAQGVVHRDLKPSNVMVTASRAKILDFGIASMAGLGARLTRIGFVMGSPMYMSPEQILARELDGRSDLYSLGILAYTLIAGHEPFGPDDPTVVALQQLQQPPPDLRRLRLEMPEPWATLLDRLLAKRPEDRFQSAQEVLDALAGLPA
jgi:tetratricopeptide (TPR) repeat protein